MPPGSTKRDRSKYVTNTLEHVPIDQRLENFQHVFGTVTENWNLLRNEEGDRKSVV